MTTPMAMPRLRQAACEGRDTELFFPEGEGPDALMQVALAKWICARCPVRRPCLEFAFSTGQRYGIWGGMTAQERRDLRRTGGSGMAIPDEVIDLTQPPVPDRRTGTWSAHEPTDG
jgi:WhiB family redox-sensing transcriptional regulator